MPRRTRRQRTATLWSKQGLTWKELAVRIYHDMNEDGLFGHCAGLAYYFLFAVFPLLVFLTTLLGYMAGESAALRMELFGYLRRIAPSGEVFGLLIDTLNEITQGRDGLKLYLSLAAALWFASNGMIAIGRTLNIACGLGDPSLVEPAADGADPDGHLRRAHHLGPGPHFLRPRAGRLRCRPPGR